MLELKKIWALSLLFVLLLNIASARDWYFAPWGSDTSPTGNSTAPLLTVTQAFTNATCGDVIYAYGNSTPYNSNSGYSIAGDACGIGNEITLTSTQGRAKFKAGVSNYETIGGVTFTNDSRSNATYGIWRSSYSTSSTDWVCFYNSTKQALFGYTPSTAAGFTDFLNYSRPYGTYWNGTPDILWFKLPPGEDPNTLSWICHKSQLFAITSHGLIFRDIDVEGGIKGFYASGYFNLSFINITLHEAQRGIDLRSGGNYTIQGNNISVKRPSTWPWGIVKGSTWEASALYLNANSKQSNVIDNDISGWFNGVLLYETAAGQAKNSRVLRNRISNIYDDAIEIEDFANCYNISSNNVTDALVAVSLSPANSTQCPSTISNNVLAATKYELFYLPSTYYSGEVYKILDPSDARNWTMQQNTEIGRIFYSDSSVSSLYGTVHKDNICYVPNSTYGRLYERTGLASNGNVHDYNLYKPASIFAKYYNSDTNTTDWATLASVKASALNATNWDYHSVESDPLFYDFANADYRPNATSPACTMSSTGSYVGALPCLAPLTTCTGTNFNMAENCTITSAITSGNITFYGTGTWTCNASIAANITFNISTGHLYLIGSQCSITGKVR